MSRRQKLAVAVFGLAVGVLAGAAREAAGGVFGDDSWNWAEMAVYVLVWAMAVPLLMRWQRWLTNRESTSRHPVVRNRRWRDENITPVLRHGILPEGIDRDAWRRPMRDEKQELEGLLWAWPAMNCLVAGLTAAAAIVANDNAWTVWAVAVVVAAQGVAGARLLWPQLCTARRLLAELCDSDAARRP